MKYIHIYTLFLMVVFLTSCGQNQTNVSKDNINYETKDTVTSYWPDKNMVGKIKEGKEGTILIVANRGVFRYDARVPDGQGKSFTNLTIKISSPGFLFWDVLEDRKGNLWLATRDSGVYYYDARLANERGKSLPAGKGGFQHFTTREGLVNNRVTSIYEDKAGIIWFGTGGGLSRYDGKSLPAGQAGFRNFTTKDGLPNNDITTIIEDKTGKLWIGTRGDPCFYDGKTFTVFRNKDGKAFDVSSIIKDRKGNLWFGGFLLDHIKRISPGGVIKYGTSGLWRYDGSTLTKVSQTRGGTVYAITEDKNGNIWTAGSTKLNGAAWALSRYDQKSLYNKNPTVTAIMSGREWNMSPLGGVLGADDGSIWFGYAGGLYRYDGKTITVF
jgi:hypothetical protein